MLNTLPLHPFSTVFGVDDHESIVQFSTHARGCLALMMVFSLDKTETLQYLKARCSSERSPLLVFKPCQSRVVPVIVVGNKADLPVDEYWEQLSQLRTRATSPQDYIQGELSNYMPMDVGRVVNTYVGQCNCEGIIFWYLFPCSFVNQNKQV